MDNKNIIPISVEKFAAYLDENLPENEMQQISQLAQDNEALNQLLGASSKIDDSLLSLDEHDLQPTEDIMESNFELPEIDNFDFFPLNEDIFSENETLYNKEGNFADESLQHDSEHLNYFETMEDKFRTIGELGENIHDSTGIEQPDDHSCGLKSQQIILRDFGIDIPFEDLEQMAKEANIYSDEGTLTEDLGKVIEMAGVGTHQIPEASIHDLTNELAQGHRVIVSVDADELWYDDTVGDKVVNWLSDTLGRQGGNHALIVAGIEVNQSDPNDVKVVLTDPGSGQLRTEYPMKQFMASWKDSNCFMVATDDAAPYQYDAETGMEVPSNFAVNHNYNQLIIDNNYQLNPNMIDVPQGYHPSFKGHLDMVGDMTYDDFIKNHDTVNNNSSNLSDDFSDHDDICAKPDTTGYDHLTPIKDPDEVINSESSNTSEGTYENINELDTIEDTSIGASTPFFETIQEVNPVASDDTNPLGDEDTGGVGDHTTGYICETTGSVGSSYLGDGSESSGGIGSVYLGDGCESSGGVGTKLLAGDSEGSGGVGGIIDDGPDTP